MKLNMLGFLGFLGLLGTLGSSLDTPALYRIICIICALWFVRIQREEGNDPINN